MPKYTGNCLCGEIEYEINGELAMIFNCFCSLCRTWGGDGYRVSTKVKASDFKWLKGEEHLKKWLYNGKVFKTWCGLCGTNLISTYPGNADVIGISMGGLKGSDLEGKRAVANIFVGSKAPWCEVPSGIPSFDDAPPVDFKP